MTAISVLIVIGLGLAYLVLLAWMLLDCWKHESAHSDKIEWTFALIVAGFVSIPIYFFKRMRGRVKMKRAQTEAKAAEEARWQHEIEHGLRKRDRYEKPDKPESRTTWTPLMTSRARWAHGHTQELLPGDLVFRFDKSWSGPFDYHGGDLGYAIERDGKIVAEYVDPTLSHVVLPKSDQTAPPKLEKTYPALEALAKEMSQTQVTKEKLASMILDKQQLQQAERSGGVLNDEEQKRLFLLKCLLGGDGLQPALETRTLSLEEADKFNAVGRFSFGQVRTLLMGQGYSRGDVIRFLERIQQGEFSSEEASQFLSDCEEWQQIMANTQESREAFFARKRAERQETKRNDPARN